MNYEIKSIFELSKGNKEKIKIDWLVKNLISKKNPTIIYGDGGTYKSLIALHLGMVVQEGLPFSNLPTQKANVLLLALEGVEDVLPRAVAHWDEYGMPEVDFFDISEGPFEFGNEEHEARRYDASLRTYEEAAVRSKTTLSSLNISFPAQIGVISCPSGKYNLGKAISCPGI